MADQNSFDKPDTTSNHSNEVFETLRASIRAAAALQPGSRTNPGVGALFRSAPSAGELLLEEATNTSGSTKATVFDSRTKVNKAGDTMTGPLTVTGARSSFVANSEQYAVGAKFSASGGFVYFGATDATSTPGWAISNAGGATVLSGTTGGRLTLPAPTSGDALNAYAATGAKVATFYGASSDGARIRCRANNGGTGGALGFEFGQGWASATDGIGYLLNGDNSDIRVQTNSQGWILRSADGSCRMVSASPKLEHETGGQVVGEVAYEVLNSRGRILMRTRDTAGANSRIPFDSTDTYTGVFGYNGGVLGAQILADGVNCKLYPGSGGVVDCGANVRPTTDNTYSSGVSGGRWSAVWAANGTIQTSDLTDKTDIAAIDGTLATRFVQGLRPILFRWLQGGQRVERIEDGFDEREVEVNETYTEEVDQPVVEDVQVSDVEHRVELRDGVAVRVSVPVTRTEQRPAGTHVTLVDEAGQPIMVQVGVEERAVGRGKNRRVEQVPVMQQATHFVPTTRRVTVERTRAVKRIERTPRFRTEVHPVPGRRTHAGFGAQDVKALMDELGIDCGLWVLGEDGKQSMRPDQLIPFLAAALASALDRIAALERRTP